VLIESIKRLAIVLKRIINGEKNFNFG